MTHYVIKEMQHPIKDIKVDLGKDLPLWRYIQMAVQDIEVINELGLHPINDDVAIPFIHVVNWKWNPHPLSQDIEYKRRETGDRIPTKPIGNIRLGILEFDIYCGAKDKNRRLETHCVHNKIYVPIEDDQGKYLVDSTKYSEYQIVDKLLYPAGRNTVILKSLLPIVISYDEIEEISMDGYHIYSKIGMVKIFTTMEPILSCFMHIPAVFSYLYVFPILQWTDHIIDDKDEYHYFQPLAGKNIYIKGHKKGLEKFNYCRSILAMACHLVRKHQPENIDQVNDPKWWVYKLSYYDAMIEQRGACHEMHVARMLDTISAQVLPIPEIDKRNMVALLRYCLQTEFTDINIYSYENKRLRHNEVISTIVTADVSEKLKKMFKFGSLLTMKDMLQAVKFNREIILKNMHKLETIHDTDFSNDLDYYQNLRATKNGPNSLGRIDKHKITFVQRQLHPTQIGFMDLLESSKDVGQSCIISPWADLTEFGKSDKNKYPNIKLELFKFIQENFDDNAFVFEAETIEEFNEVLDKLVTMSTFELNYNVECDDEERMHDPECRRNMF